MTAVHRLLGITHRTLGHSLALHYSFRKKSVSPTVWCDSCTLATRCLFRPPVPHAQVEKQHAYATATIFPALAFLRRPNHIAGQPPAYSQKWLPKRKNWSITRMNFLKRLPLLLPLVMVPLPTERLVPMATRRDPTLVSTRLVSGEFKDHDKGTSVDCFGCRDFLLKPELLRAISDLGFEHPSEGKSISFSHPVCRPQLLESRDQSDGGFEGFGGNERQRGRRGDALIRRIAYLSRLDPTDSPARMYSAIHLGSGRPLSGKVRYG